MLKREIFFIIFFLMTFYPGGVWGSHPFKTEHADAYGKGNVRFLVEGEAEQEGGHEKHYGLPVVEVVYSFGQWTSLSIEHEFKFIAHNEEVHSTSGVGDVSLYFKHSPFHLEYGDIGARIGVKIPTAKDDKHLGTGEPDFEFLLIHSFLSERLATHFNCGVRVLGNPEHRSRNEAVFRYSAAMVIPLHKKIELFTEVEGQSAKSVFGHESLLRSGFIFPLTKSFEIGFAGGVGLTNDSPDWEARGGIYWTWQRGEELPPHQH